MSIGGIGGGAEGGDGSRTEDAELLSGSWRSIRHLRGELDPAVMERLEAAGAGRR